VQVRAVTGSGAPQPGNVSSVGEGDGAREAAAARSPGRMRP